MYNGSNAWLLALEDHERTRPGTLNDEDYAKMILAYLSNRAPMDISYLWKRIPDRIKVSQILTALADTGKHLEDKAFSLVHTVYDAIAWPEGLAVLAADVRRRLEELSVEHIRQVYDVISLERFAAIVGIDLGSADDYVKALGFDYDPIKHMVSIGSFAVLPATAMLDEEEWSADLDSLEMIGDTVWALEKPPLGIGDAHSHGVK